MQVWDRRLASECEEPEYGKKKLEFLYHTIPGRFLLKGIFATHWYAELERWKQSRKSSARTIASFCQQYKIESDGNTYVSFRDFFLRERSYHTDCGNEELIAIADSRLSCFDIDDNLCLNIKSSSYTLEELLGRDDVMASYAGGKCLVFRLAVQDYHRYVYLDGGRVLEQKKIQGQLHTVRPVSEQYRVFARNAREYMLLDTDHFGMVVQMEVGALLVGKICNYPESQFERLQEKGYFDYGGSTIVLLFEAGRIALDDDILKMSERGMECVVKIGEKIGYAKTNGNLL